MPNRNVIYTAIFGWKDELIEPAVVPPGFDFICFTDSRHFKSKVWKVRVVERTLPDPVREARMYKVLPHRYLPEYELSMWIDGNFLVRGDVHELIENHLGGNPIGVFDHRNNRWDPWKDVYEEADALLGLHKRGRFKDDPALIKTQVQRYHREGFESQNGHIVSQILVRRHMDSKVRETMELWWKEIQGGSRRDQLSFNYAAWKTGLPLTYFPGDSRDNQYFKHTFHTTHRLSLWRRAWRKFKHLLGIEKQKTFVIEHGLWQK